MRLALLSEAVCLAAVSLLRPAAALDLRAAVDAYRRVEAMLPTVPGSVGPGRQPFGLVDPLTIQEWNENGAGSFGREFRPAAPASGHLPSSWSSCGHDDDIFHIKHLRIDPDPPERGKDLRVEGAGHLDEEIVQGAVAHVSVKIGVIHILNKEFDLCNELRNQGNDRIKCPIRAGDIEVADVLHVPQEVPPGRYTINARVRNADGKPVTCVNARFVL